MNTTFVTRAAGLIVACFLAALPAAAQDVAIPSIGVDGSLSVNQLESAIQSVQAREGLSDEIRSSVIDQLRDAQTQVQNRLAAEAAATDFADSLSTAPAETAALRADLDAA